MIVQGQVAVCQDCYLWHNNGDDTGFCDCTNECASVEHQAIRHATGLVGILPGVPDHFVHLVPGNEDDNYGFCWRTPCDACGSRLGGERYAMTLLTP